MFKIWIINNTFLYFFDIDVGILFTFGNKDMKGNFDYLAKRIGYRIAQEELNGEDRARYGAEIIKRLAKDLTIKYGKGFTKSNLYSFYSFYKAYPGIFQTLSGKSSYLLSWSLELRTEIRTQKAMYYLKQLELNNKE